MERGDTSDVEGGGTSVTWRGGDISGVERTLSDVERGETSVTWRGGTSVTWRGGTSVAWRGGDLSDVERGGHQ